MCVQFSRKWQKEWSTTSPTRVYRISIFTFFTVLVHRHHRPNAGKNLIYHLNLTACSSLSNSTLLRNNAHADTPEDRDLFYLVEISFGHAQWLGEVITEAIPRLSVERQPGLGWRCGPDPHRCVERLRWNASRFTPAQLHLKPHNNFTYDTKHQPTITVGGGNHTAGGAMEEWLSDNRQLYRRVQPGPSLRLSASWKPQRLCWTSCSAPRLSGATWSSRWPRVRTCRTLCRASPRSSEERCKRKIEKMSIQSVLSQSKPARSFTFGLMQLM